MPLGNSSDASQEGMTVKEIISVYSNHLSIRKIKNLCVPENKFVLPYAGTSGINKINHSHANYVIINITQITKTGIFVFIAVLVFKLSRRKVLFINKIFNRNC